MQAIWEQSWVREIPWRREWQPTPVLLPGEFHGQRSLAGYSPWDHKESDTTEQLTVSLSPLIIKGSRRVQLVKDTDIRNIREARVIPRRWN